MTLNVVSGVAAHNPEVGGGAPHTPSLKVDSEVTLGYFTLDDAVLGRPDLLISVASKLVVEFSHQRLNVVFIANCTFDFQLFQASVNEA